METKQKKQLAIGLAVYAIIFLLILLVTNIGKFNLWLNGLFQILRPLIIGLVVAYLCNPFFRFFEGKMFVKIRPISLRRVISLIFTYLVLILIIGILVMLIVPQLVDSIMSFIEDADTFLNTSVGEINKLIDIINQRVPPKENGQPAVAYLNAEKLKETVLNFFNSLNFDAKKLLDLMNANTISSIFGIANNVLSIFTDTIFGLFISLYFLHTKEKRYAQVMRLRRAVFSESVNQTITKICTTADKNFGGFIRGKILDSSIVGVLVYFAISLFDIPFAILIAVIVAITDIIPIIGPFIGVFPSAVIILLTDPPKVIPFVLCILVIQQIDGNIIAPKILGENTGVSSLCVMIAITTMGSLWGLVGMIIGVPLFATVLELTSDYLDKRLQKKGFSGDSESHYAYELVSVPKEEYGNWIQRMQKKKRLRFEQESIGGNGDLSAIERFGLDSYALMHKHKIFSKKNVDIPQDFIDDENTLIEMKKEELEIELNMPDEKEIFDEQSETSI